jgi:hypothetical protein
MREPDKPCYNCGSLEFDWFWLFPQDETDEFKDYEVQIWYCKCCKSEQ